VESAAFRRRSVVRSWGKKRKPALGEASSSPVKSIVIATLPDSAPYAWSLELKMPLSLAAAVRLQLSKMSGVRVGIRMAREYGSSASFFSRIRDSIP
jgi:hypothetical protein